MKKNLLALFFLLISSPLSWAAIRDVECIGKGQPLPVHNEQVLEWKSRTPNKYLNRGHIEGVLTRVYPNKTGHIHISVQIGDQNDDTIEVVYNENFGRVPKLNVGSTVQACGDYITSNSPTGKYPASPDGAILHWVHRSTNNRHESGFMAIDGVVYGD